MRKLLLALVTLLVPYISCWKPISVHPSAFSVSQSYPQLGSESTITRKSSNELLNSDTVDIYVDSFHKDDYIHRNQDVSVLRHLKDGRNSKALQFESTIFNGFFHDDSCAFDKYAIDHEGTINYDTHSLKTLEQFTLCLWMRFTKHDGDHALFTYAVHDEPREIQFWISNVNRTQSFISLAVRGHSLYRLNYPLKMKQWHHTCTSWNGKTGEWQLWVKSERVGRGFYNRLVSHEIESGGKAFSGGKSITGPTDTGLHMELTSVQLYSVALSAGKAHRDHKHHHVHKFDHEGEISTTTTAPRPAIVANQVANPLLANGQFPSRVRINLAGVQSPAPLVASTPLPTINTNFVRGQFNAGARNLQTQLLAGNYLQLIQSQSQFSAQPTVPTFTSPSANSGSSIRFPSQPAQNSNGNDGAFSYSSTFTGFTSQPANVEIIDESQLPDLRFKRQTAKLTQEEEKKAKRGLVELTDGTVVDDKFFDSDWYDGLAQFGGSEFKNSLTKHDNLEDEIREHDREPAEGEVDAVRQFCNSCLVEPFDTALVVAWKSASASSGVLKAKASKVCGDF